jgi:hypothetical protein
MSFKISIIAPGMNLSATLKDEALPRLIELSQKFRDESGPVTDSNESAPSQSKEMPLVGNSEDAVKVHLKDFAAAELLNRLRWDSYPEKILLLGAWFEARGGSVPWKSADMDEVFRQAKEKPPANFPRDIKQAIKAAWIHPITARTYCVTRTGWNKLAEALSR